MTPNSLRRRRVLGLTASAVALGLAGCSGGSTNDASGDDSGSDSGDSDGGDSEADAGADFGGWFDNVGNFDGVVDRTGQSEVTVTVGAEGNGGAYAFGPAAVKIDAGTTIRWAWRGEGGSHNVVDDGGAFESKLLPDKGHVFEYTFDETGTFKYVCVPHEAMGMKGAVVVE